MKHVFSLLLALPMLAFAHGSSHTKSPQETVSSAMSFEQAQRAMHFASDRNWQDTEGRILVCRYPNRANGDNGCFNKEGQSAWEALENLQLPGYEISFIDYRFTGTIGYRSLIVYFRKKK